jgi:predicted RNase H-like nuclease (RuvC/YqgF family)
LVALDLRGNVVLKFVDRDVGEERIVRIIRKTGIPSIIATDVSPAPHLVEKIAARFNVKVFSPPRSLMQEEKDKIAKDIQDPHLRDAYAASVKAYREHANRMRQIDKLDLDEERKDKIKHLIIQGIRADVAIEMVR